MIKSRITSDIIVNSGLFILLVSFFEDTLKSLSAKYFKCYPKRMTSLREKNLNYIIPSNIEALGEAIADAYSKGVSDIEVPYSVIDLYLGKNKYKNNTSPFNTTEFCEILTYRNYIVHDSWMIPSERIHDFVAFPPEGKTDKKGDMFIVLSDTRMNEFTKSLSDWLTCFEDETSRRYPHYSRVKHLESIWNQYMASPLLVFTEYWEIDTKNDRITGILHPKHEDYLSSSEKTFLRMWRYEYSDDIQFLPRIRSLSISSPEIISSFYKAFQDSGFAKMVNEKS
jgi:hypothetical protein